MLIRSFCQYFLKLILNKTDTQRQVKQDKSEIYHYTQSNRPAACIKCSMTMTQYKMLNGKLQLLFLLVNAGHVDVIFV